MTPQNRSFLPMERFMSLPPLRCIIRRKPLRFHLFRPIRRRLKTPAIRFFICRFRFELTAIMSFMAKAPTKIPFKIRQRRTPIRLRRNPAICGWERQRKMTIKPVRKLQRGSCLRLTLRQRLRFLTIRRSSIL